jgi:hypothetical protein
LVCVVLVLCSPEGFIIRVTTLVSIVGNLGGFELVLRPGGGFVVVETRAV